MNNKTIATVDNEFKFKEGKAYMVEKEFGKPIDHILRECITVSNYNVNEDDNKYNVLFITLEKSINEFSNSIKLIDKDYDINLLMHYSKDGKIEDVIKQYILSSHNAGRKTLSVIIDRLAVVERPKIISSEDYISILANRYNISIIGIRRLPRKMKPFIVVDEL